MAQRISGAVFADLVHRISESLLDSETLEDIFFPPLLVYVKEIDTKRIFFLEKDTVGEALTFEAPEGRIWKVLYARLQFDADANVADRVVQAYMASPEAAHVANWFYEDAIAASAQGLYQLGARASTANDAGGDKNAEQPTLIEGMAFTFTATNIQVGDTFDVKAIIEETVNYEP